MQRVRAGSSWLLACPVPALAWLPLSAAGYCSRLWCPRLLTPTCCRTGYLDAYLKYGAPPGWGPHEYDLRPDWNAALKDKALEVVLDPTKPQFRTGTWWVCQVPGFS